MTASVMPCSYSEEFLGQETDSLPLAIKYHCLLFFEDYIFNAHYTTTGNTSLTVSFDNHSLMVFKFTQSDNGSCHA